MAGKSHLTHMCEGAPAHMDESCWIHMIRSYCTYEWVPSRIRKRQTRQTMWRESLIWHVCDMTHSYVRHDSIVSAIWLIHTWKSHLTHICPSYGPWRKESRQTYEWVMSHIRMSRTHMCQTLFNVRHDPFICVAWMSHDTQRNESHTYASDSF